MGDILFVISQRAGMRNDVMRYVLLGIRDFAGTENLPSPERASLEKSIAHWLEELERAAPGTARVDLEEWITDENRRTTFLKGLASVERRWQELVHPEHYKFLREINAFNMEPLKRIVATANLAPVASP